MATFTWSSVIDVPFGRVWDFHSRVDGLQALTPSWVGLTVESVSIPGNKDGDILIPGAEIELTATPFGIVPGGTWRSRITERHEDDGSAMFQDIVVDGPLEDWTHTHYFTSLPYGTLIHDSVEYSLPVSAASPLLHLPLAGYFAYRHRRTERLLTL